MYGVDTKPFLASVLDSLPQQIAVIDAQGVIRWVNRSWRTFSAENGGDPDRVSRGANYLRACREAPGCEDALIGIESVVSGAKPVFYLEYPCHSPTERRWFMMRVRPLEGDPGQYFIISHDSITERKLAEMRVAEMAVVDGLTGIANRRRFDSFLDDKWRSARRLGLPLSLALVDIDFFKAYNDHYGHLAGDECLRRVAGALKSFARRPDDLAARNRRPRRRTSSRSPTRRSTGPRKAAATVCVICRRLRGPGSRARTDPPQLAFGRGSQARRWTSMPSSASALACSSEASP